MLRELLFRDLASHRRVLITASILPLSSLAILTFGSKEVEGVAVAAFVFGLLTLCFLPHTLHLREKVLGTLGDMLVLPVPRRDLVRLRFLEGSLACALFAAAFLILAPPAQGPKNELRSMVFMVLWLLVALMAYPLPFTLRWGGKGLAGALGGLAGALFLVGQAMLHSRAGMQRVLAFMETIQGLPAAMGPMLGGLFVFAVPLMLLGIFYLASLWAVERIDA